ncbi:hypothetical protein DSCA_00440 [Desulfosarcina alkanivorans]|uniref:Response regulatory domain-containing protein n=1 Tax=Desulfosarcina alkanivorans TaxID=571177 RepID=A0A5K7YI76_9BACT|nr:response regulator [Desulfosarcina alkanivorans]BBO66114.1 hypothetical protein DSCA_00440 [Desulfosarcina alkanivorans]
MLTHRKVLILDPSPIFRQTLMEVVRKSVEHVEIKEANTAIQARDILRNKAMDVLFMDIALPESNGIELIASIKDILPNIIIVVLTSHDTAEYKEASLLSGADYFLSKERSGGLRLIDVIHTTLPKQTIAS